MRRFMLLAELILGVCLVPGSSIASTTTIPIQVTNYTLKPPFMADGAGSETGLRDWRLPLIDPYTDQLDYKDVRMRYFGCDVTPDTRPPQILLSGTITPVAGVAYHVDYRISGASPSWKVLEPLDSTNMTAGGSFSAEWFHTQSWCPTRNVSFRVSGTDGTNQYVSPVKTVRVYPRILIPKEGLSGSVWMQKLRVKDPGVHSIQVRFISKKDPNQTWRLKVGTKFAFIRSIPVVGGFATFKYRVVQHKTYVFRYTLPPTSRHAKMWLFQPHIF